MNSKFKLISSGSEKRIKREKLTLDQEIHWKSLRFITGRYGVDVVEVRVDGICRCAVMCGE